MMPPPIFIKIAMSEEFNQNLSLILQKYSRDPPTLIQELFNLLPLQKPEEKKITQTAILYSMQTIHEWENIMKYIQKWNQDSFRKSLIERMCRRLDEEISSINTNEELNRLIQKYWLTHSPKKVQNNYKEPIDIREKIKRIEASSSKPLPPLQQQSKPEISEEEQNLKQKKEEGQLQKKRRETEILNSLTGRPAILKKTSLFDWKKNKKEETKKEESNKEMEIEIKPQKVNSNEILDKNMEIEKPKGEKIMANPEKDDRPKNVLKQLVAFCGKTSKDQKVSEFDPEKPEKKEQKMERSQSNGSNQPNEPFPSSQQFIFGSTKKVKDGDLKRLTISPNKRLQVSNKIVKIKRTQYEEPQQQQNKEGKFDHDFSFMNDNFESLKPMSLPSSDPFVYPDKNSSETLPEFLQKNSNVEIENMGFVVNSGQQGSQQITPIFAPPVTFEQKKQQFLSVEELKMIEDVKPRHYLRNMMKRRGITAMNIFHQELKKLGIKL